MATHWTDPDSKFFKIITTRGGTSEELGKAMKRKYGPGKQQLEPIAKDYGYRYLKPKKVDGRFVYRFSAKKARKMAAPPKGEAKQKAQATRSTPPQRKRSSKS